MTTWWRCKKWQLSGIISIGPNWAHFEELLLGNQPMGKHFLGGEDTLPVVYSLFPIINQFDPGWPHDDAAKNDNYLVLSQ